jgi:hypothetical protein
VKPERWGDNADVDVFASHFAGGRSDDPNVIPALCTGDNQFQIDFTTHFTVARAVPNS